MFIAMQIEVELANLKNRLRQEAEAVETVLDAAMQQQLQALIVKQAERRDQLMKSQLQVQKDLEEQSKVTEEKCRKEIEAIELSKQAREVQSHFIRLLCI